MASQENSDVALHAIRHLRSSGFEESEEVSTQRRRQRGEEGDHGQEFSLPRADGGRDAWLFLAACFSIEALVWGERSIFVFPGIGFYGLHQTAI